MKNTRYDRIADSHKAQESRLLNAVVAFISGGILGMMAEGVIEFLCHFLGMDRVTSATYMILFFIFLASFLTALGVFDRLVSHFKCGLLIPITGFAHSMTSCGMDYRREGPIYGFGSNLFKLAGSVLLYGIVSACFLGIIRYLLGVIA